MRHISSLVGAVALAAATLTPTWALAQDHYPSRAVTIVVPLAPGGGVDTIARMVAEKLSQSLGQPFVVDNKPGAAGNIGSEYVTRARPDGYTLLFNGNSHTVNPSLYKLRFNPRTDFTPIARVVETPQIMLIHSSVPANDLKEFLEYAKNNPGKLNYGSAGVGSPSHIAGELFKQKAGVDMTHVPYKGSGPATADLLGGQIQVLFSSLPSAVPHLAGGKVKAMGVSTVKRSRTAPDIPTLAEAGVPDYRMDTWFGLLAPAGLPDDIRDKLASELVNITSDPAFQKAILDAGMEVAVNTPDEFSKMLDAEFDYWPKFIEQTGIMAE